MKTYFESKDFKNSKKFWNFYKSSIKTRGDIDLDSSPEELIWNNTKIFNPVDQVEMFNSCFASIAFSSFSGKNDSAKYIFDDFRELKSNNSISTSLFSFIEFSYDEIKKVLDELPSSSSPGFIDIHPKILKSLPDLFVPLLHLIYNDSLRLKSIPDDWKLAIVNPLFKNKGNKSDINNYRAISVLSPISKMFHNWIRYWTNSKFHF